MRDLVKRLRDPPLAERNEGIKIDAADEIERLRAALRGLNAAFMDIPIKVPTNRMKAILAASKEARAVLEDKP